jgi:thioredoxin reductase
MLWICTRYRAQMTFWRNFSASDRTAAEAAGDCRPLETSHPGVFAIGDVRSSSVKRVAAAVGEGAQVVATLHAFLAARDRERAGIARLSYESSRRCNRATISGTIF